MKKLDAKILEATPSSLLANLDALKSIQVRNRRTPSDIVTACVALCTEARRTHPQLEKLIYNLEDQMWMVNECYDALWVLSINARWIPVKI